MTEINAGEQPGRLQESYFAAKPTRATRFMRTFIPWQIWRFAVINFRMARIIFRSHG
jgi:hypothetical protein